LLRDDGEGKGQHLFGHINMETLATIHKKLTPVISEIVKIAQLENLPELEAHSPQISDDELERTGTDNGSDNDVEQSSGTN